MASTDIIGRKREATKRSQRDANAEAADIGSLHAVVDPRRRHLCSWNLGLWLQTYFPNSTGLGPFSVDHYSVIDSLESAFTAGGWYANAVFREFAKTSISEGAALWAVMNAHRRFIPVFGADQDAANEILESMRIELEENDLLFEDYPEVCVGFRALEGKHQRCRSQSFGGDLTHIDCVGDTIVLPTIRLSAEQSKELGIRTTDSGYTLCSGGILSSHGLLSAARGMKHKRPDGTQQRPDGAIIDDPQTDRSAESRAEIAKRLRVIRKAIIPMAGQRRKLALVVNGTTIVEDDVMCMLRNPDISPAWQSRSIPMLRSKSLNEKLWLEDYAKILTTWDRENPDAQIEAKIRATAFYLEHRAAMDEGCHATWHTCYSADQHEISAEQHAYNVLIEQGEDVFDSEAQQQPKRLGAKSDDMKLADVISLANGVPRRDVPLWANRVTVMTDVQDDVLYWLTLATGDGFRAHVCDYGIYPEQTVNSYAKRDAKRRLRDVYRGSIEASLQSGLRDLLEHHRASQWQRQGDSVILTPSVVGVDSGDNTTTVYAAIRQSGGIPTKGRSVLAKQVQWADFPEREGEEIDREYHWLQTPTRGSKELRVLQFDANWWKSFVLRRMRTPENDAGSLSLFGTPKDHVDFANHVLAEYAESVTVNNRMVNEWSCKVGADNHLLDCLIGAFVLSAKSGATLTGVAKYARPTVHRVSYSQLQRERKQRA